MQLSEQSAEAILPHFRGWLLQDNMKELDQLRLCSKWFCFSV